MAHLHPYVEDLIRRHAAGDRSPALLSQLDLLAWSEFHETREAPPTKADTPEEAAIQFLRTRPGYALMTNNEILECLSENPMLLAQEGIEASLESGFKATNQPSGQA